MFDRAACPDVELLAAQPFVSIDALAALSALLDLALKDRTPSAALLSGASRAFHDQNRGETHVTDRRQCQGADTDTIDNHGRTRWICSRAAYRTAPSARPHGRICRRRLTRIQSHENDIIHQARSPCLRLGAGSSGATLDRSLPQGGPPVTSGREHRV